MALTCSDMIVSDEETLFGAAVLEEILCKPRLFPEMRLQNRLYLRTINSNYLQFIIIKVVLTVISKPGSCSPWQWAAVSHQPVCVYVCYLVCGLCDCTTHMLVKDEK